MNKPPDERKNERDRARQNWDNEGGGQLPNVPPGGRKDNDQDREGIKRGESIPASPAKVTDTLFSSTYFVKLWNAGSRTVKTLRVSGRGDLLSINPDNLEDHTVFRRNHVLTLVRHSVR